ncbi:hypothetical protein [Actinospica sp.]|uniref:hypothetical protein n=1 Tax=Actinospica sp. TaxID=1872142 RepID=UPI002C59D331|nr:hypothetical protein [Actinospica sp.]HWG27592.1 hypothetical protein [Actinospica sp.]
MPETVHPATSSAATGVVTPTPTPSAVGGDASASTPQPGTTQTTAAAASAAFPGIWDITSWKAYRAAQASVEQGHQPWLLDPELVVSAWAHRWTPVPAVRQIAPDTFQVTEPGTSVIYTIRGTRPDPNSATPIWVITAISHT